MGNGKWGKSDAPQHCRWLVVRVRLSTPRELAVHLLQVSCGSLYCDSVGRYLMVAWSAVGASAQLPVRDFPRI
jgi:hypothetical protein